MANISIETKKFTQLPTTQSLTDSSLMLARDVAGVKTIQFSDLRAQLQGQTYVQDLKSKNIFYATIEQGAVTSNGGEQSKTDVIRSQYNSVSASTAYAISWTNAFWVSAYYFDSSKTIISYEFVLDTEGTSASFTTPSTCSYVRFNFGKSNGSDITPSNISNIQLELGDTVTSYVPYAMDVVEITNYKQNKLGVKRVEFERTINANSDTAFSPSDILTQAGLPNAKALIIIPEGTRPKDSWTEVHPVMFYLATSGTWGVHNYGTGGVAIVDFILVYDSYLYS